VRSERAFSLIELLVVIALIGIFLTAITLSLGGDRRGDELAEESQRFQALLEMAHEQAMLCSEEWAVQIEPDRYQFLQLINNEWLPVENDRLLRPRDFAKGTELDLELEGREARLAVVEEGYKPTLLLLSSGEITPFNAVFLADDTERRFRVTGDLLGELSWEVVDS